MEGAVIFLFCILLMFLLWEIDEYNIKREREKNKKGE